jgi:hypothetical protein
VRWVASFRDIPNIDADRARVRWTLSYRFTETFQAGLEYSPRDEDWGPIGNWTAVTETRNRPALILGTSSDRIGTDRGQSYYGTLSKSLEPWIDLPVSPYAGAAFRDADDDWEPVAGLNYWLLDRRLSVTHLWDGENLHHTLDVPWRRAVFGLIVAQQAASPGDRGDRKEYFLGLTFGLRLPQPGFLRD